MRSPFQTITLSVMAIAIMAITWISCNKDNNTTSKTTIKCVTCANGGSCINDTCRCPLGYEGVTCQTLSYQKFLGEWIVSEKGSNTATQQYEIEIEEQSGISITAVTIQGLYGPYLLYYGGSSLTGSINGDSIFIPSQPVDSGYIVGKGYFTANPSTGQGTITFRYQVSNVYTNVINDFGYNSPVDSPSVWKLD